MKMRGWLFNMLYLLGRTPWDTEITPPEVMALVEGGSIAPGRALDLGCGTGVNCIYLARRGWEAVGVDFSAVAIRRARRKARRAGANCRFYQADVTDLSFLDPGNDGPFDLALDVGCLHNVPQENWERYAVELARLLRVGGLYLLYTFGARSDRPVPRGMSPDEVRDLFTAAFAVERQEGGDDPTGPQSFWYWLRRVD